MPLFIQDIQAKLVSYSSFYTKCTGRRPSLGIWHKYSLWLLPTTKRTTWGENGFNWCFNPETKAKDWSHWARFDYQLKRSLFTPSTILSTFISGDFFRFSSFFLLGGARIVFLLIRFLFVNIFDYLFIRKKRKRQHRFFIPFNLTAVKNDIAILKVHYFCHPTLYKMKKNQ